jgi:hypothetical protein
MATFTNIRVALYRRPHGRTASHTTVSLLGAVPHELAVAKTRDYIESDRVPPAVRDYLLNCLDTNNFSVEVVQS